VDTETVGFFVGTAPGAAIVLSNMWHQQALQRHIRTVAWQERSWKDTQLGFKQQLALLFRPHTYLAPNDTPELARAKRALLSAWPQIRRRHLVGGCVAVVGAIVGTAAGALLA
jgi:hypothetical protein